MEDRSGGDFAGKVAFVTSCTSSGEGRREFRTSTIRSLLTRPEIPHLSSFDVERGRDSNLEGPNDP